MLDLFQSSHAFLAFEALSGYDVASIFGLLSFPTGYPHTSLSTVDFARLTRVLAVVRVAEKLSRLCYPNDVCLLRVLLRQDRVPLLMGEPPFSVHVCGNDNLDHLNHSSASQA
jgi:hypothetical protein